MAFPQKDKFILSISYYSSRVFTFLKVNFLLNDQFTIQKAENRTKMLGKMHSFHNYCNYNSGGIKSDAGSNIKPKTCYANPSGPI